LTVYSDYSGALPPETPQVQPVTLRVDIRPDTPPPADDKSFPPTNDEPLPSGDELPYEFETDDNGRYMSCAKGKGRVTA
jgi:hypothetical protein